MSTGKKEGRRHLLTALGAAALFSLLKFPLPRLRRKPIACAPPSKTNAPALRLLDQNGRLVEVDPSKIRLLKKKISNDELKDWIRHSS